MATEEALTFLHSKEGPFGRTSFPSLHLHPDGKISETEWNDRIVTFVLVHEGQLWSASEVDAHNVEHMELPFSNPSGDPEMMKAAYSHASDVMIMGALGGYEQGWDKVGPRLDWALKQFHGTRNQSFERLAAGNNADFGYEVFLEKSEARTGDTYLPMTLRVTHVFRKESGEWKLVHRHADPLKLKAPQ